MSPEPPTIDHRPKPPIDKVIGIALVACLLSSTPASPNVVVCEGKTCVEVNGSRVRHYTEEEVIRKKRSDARGHLYNIDCSVADVPPACRYAVQEMLKHFSGNR